MFLKFPEQLFGTDRLHNEVHAACIECGLPGISESAGSHHDDGGVFGGAGELAGEPADHRICCRRLPQQGQGLVLAGGAGLPLVAWFLYPGLSLAFLGGLVVAGFVLGIVVTLLFGSGGFGGPFFGGWELYHLKGSPVDPNRIYASQTSAWFGQMIQRSDDGGKTWEPVGNKFVYDGVPGPQSYSEPTPAFDAGRRPCRQDEFPAVSDLCPGRFHAHGDPVRLPVAVALRLLHPKDVGRRCFEEHPVEGRFSPCRHANERPPACVGDELVPKAHEGVTDVTPGVTIFSVTWASIAPSSVASTSHAETMGGNRYAEVHEGCWSS